MSLARELGAFEMSVSLMNRLNKKSFVFKMWMLYFQRITFSDDFVRNGNMHQRFEKDAGEVFTAFTVAGVVQCGGRKTSRTSTKVQFIFYFWSFEISVNILRNQKLMIGLDSCSRHGFNYLDSILIYVSL